MQTGQSTTAPVRMTAAAQAAALQAEVEKLRNENAALKAKQQTKQHFTLKVSPKGAVAIYGLGRFPVTLYKGQMERLLNEKDNITAFITANAEALKTKEATA